MQYNSTFLRASHNALFYSTSKVTSAIPRYNACGFLLLMIAIVDIDSLVMQSLFCNLLCLCAKKSIHALTKYAQGVQSV